jgi:hypothetical protein
VLRSDFQNNVAQILLEAIGPYGFALGGGLALQLDTRLGP